MAEKHLRIYLDNCCYNRPYDNQTQLRISLESQAKIFIQNAVKLKKFELASSFVLQYENSKNPYSNRKNNISNFISQNTALFVNVEKVNEVAALAKEIMCSGVKETDAAHIACAILAACDYFLTTDDRVLKYRDDRIKIINPVDFVKILEANNYV